MSSQLYLNDTYLFDYATTITGYGADEKGTYLLLQETIFHPQGGGQPSDQGTIKVVSAIIQVTFVRKIDQEIRHYIVNGISVDGLVNAEAKINIDPARRLMNARYHTAAHLLSNLAEEMYSDLKAIKGHSFPGEAYVEFIGESVPVNLDLAANINSAIKQGLITHIFEILPNQFETKYYKLPYTVPAHKAFRVLQIGNYPPVPCGGTHISNIAEIGELIIRKSSQKDGRLKISYALVD